MWHRVTRSVVSSRPARAFSSSVVGFVSSHDVLCLDLTTSVCVYQERVPLFIDGKFVQSKTDKWIDLLNPVQRATPAASLGRGTAFLVEAHALN
ncbi:hypothetical protein PsorP6_013545 [Peronosclerospora sorghi]|uniref:Uncharacterized protein n=1 Tax=Peronosclerospora sorghi TaxID=230839 RepID=A0ACC0VG69_9STRA|nr:hypothetical protein PsorP6_013545 [Peronosclerospora sorghi]